MKKFYVLLAALLIASASFAQVTLPKKVVKKDGTTLNIKGKPAKNNPQKSTSRAADCRPYRFYRKPLNA